MTDPGGDQPTIDDLLDRAVSAINRGDRATADELATQVLEVDQDNSDAEELLAAPTDHAELRRLTLLFVDMVDSTKMSTAVEPETYRLVVGRYRDDVLRLVERYEGHISETKGDGLLALFGHPRPHEDDIYRAVQAGLDITREVARLSSHVRRRFGLDLDVRVGVHRGVVYLDTRRDEVYGYAVNLAARVCSIADPGTVAVSEVVAQLAQSRFEFDPGIARQVKGVDAPILPYRAVAEREPTRNAQGPLVGRDDEIALLRRRWDDTRAAATEVSALGFFGEPGIGKSRLIGEAITLAEESGAVPVELFGSPLHVEVGLHPFRRMLERRCGILSTTDAEDRLHRLSTEIQTLSLQVDVVVPLLAPVLSIPAKAGYTPVATDGPKLESQISQMLQEYVLACTRSGHALVIAEDMHWFDPLSTELVRTLIGAKIPGVLVVMTSRTLAAIPARGTDIRELTALNNADSDALITTLHPEISETGRAEVKRRCAGVPLYIEEVVAKLAEGKTDTNESLQVPDTLYEALFARLRSSENAIQLAQAAATIGRRFDRGTLAPVLDMTGAEIDETLSELSSGRVIEPLGTTHWGFRHELLREVAAELPPPAIRQRLHGRVADALKSVSLEGDPDWPVIADHYAKADRREDAAVAYQDASSSARQRGALTEASSYLSRALAQLELQPRSPGRDLHEMRVRLARGFLTVAIEGPGSAATTSDFERCLELGDTNPDADEMFWTLQALFTYYVGRADLRRAKRIVESLHLVLTDEREWCRVEVVGGDTILSFLRGEFSDAQRYMKEAHRLLTARTKRDFDSVWFMPYDAIVLDYINLAHTRWVTGDITGADAAFAESDARLAELPIPQGPYSACYARWVQVWAYLEADRVDKAAALSADMLQIAGTHGFDQWALLGSILLSTTSAIKALANGDNQSPDIANSVAGLLGWASMGRMVGAYGWLTWFDGLAARMLLAAGQTEQARQQVDLGLQLAADTGMRFYDAELIRFRAATRTNDDERLADLIAAFNLARAQGTPVFALRAARDAHHLEPGIGRQLLDEAIAMFPAGSTWPGLDHTRTL